MNTNELKEKALEVNTIVLWLVWAVANRPQELMKAVYGDHTQGYLNEKIEMSNRNFTGWWSELSPHLQDNAINFAIERYNKED